MNAPLKNVLNKQNVYQKLNDARLRLQGTKLTKSGHNKFAGYQYFELGDFLPAIQSIFADIGLCGVIGFGKESACLTIVNTEAPGEVIEIHSPMSSAALKGCHEVQNLGAVQTYIRRYLWVTALEIVEHDALEPTTKSDQVEVKKHLPPVKAAMQSVEVDAESQAILRDLAAELVQIVEVENDPKAAYKRMLEVNPNQDEKLFLWDVLSPNSKTRSALKKESQTAREAA